jgi:hypothetical protein
MEPLPPPPPYSSSSNHSQPPAIPSNLSRNNSRYNLPNTSHSNLSSFFTNPNTANRQSSRTSESPSKYQSPPKAIGWEIITPNPKSRSIPCQRSLHAGAIWKNFFLIFGGYDGTQRVNDLYAYNMEDGIWEELNRENAPSPRDRHIAVVYGDELYIFGGFDGATRVNGKYDLNPVWLQAFFLIEVIELSFPDLHSYNLVTNQWQPITAIAGNPPTPRHSHAAVVYQDAMYVFGGYDGSYRSDFHAFQFSSRTWRVVSSSSDILPS